MRQLIPGHLAPSIPTYEFIQTNNPDAANFYRKTQQRGKLQSLILNIMRVMPTAYLNILVLLDHIHHSEIRVYSVR